MREVNMFLGITNAVMAVLGLLIGSPVYIILLNVFAAYQCLSDV